MKGQTGIAAVGDVTDINTWSSTPYYFYQACLAAGMKIQPWQLQLNKFRTPRIYWNLWQSLLFRGKGGYQYSQEFLDKAEQQIPAGYFGSDVISFNQLFPRATSVTQKGGRIFYYIDSTLHNLFDERSYGIDIPDRMKQIAIEQERENYHKAEVVVSMGTWVHDSLKNFYGLNEKKIMQVLPGANISLPKSFLPVSYQSGAGKTRELVLGFIGKDWKRKGLPLLMDVRDELERMGLKATVLAIGNFPEEWSSRKGFRHTGYINKQTDTEKFISSVASCDLGCLFSDTEALGISILEFLHMGVPVMGWDHQGLKDTLLPGASFKFDPGTSVPDIAKRIASVVDDDDQFRKLKETAVALAPSVSWTRTAQSWKNILTR